MKNDSRKKVIQEIRAILYSELKLPPTPDQLRKWVRWLSE